MKYILSPSILDANFYCLKEVVDILKKHGINWLHLDVMDGHFVPNITFGPLIVETLRSNTDLCLDTHLMIENPDKFVEKFVAAGADIITVHWETVKDFKNIAQTIKKAGKKVGISIKPKTPVEPIKPFIKDLDLILLMTVEPGFGGQKFMTEVQPKIVQLRKLINNQNPLCDIEVDGGINKDTIHLAIESGANAFVVGQSIFRAPNIEESLENFKKILTKYQK